MRESKTYNKYELSTLLCSKRTESSSCFIIFSKQACSFNNVLSVGLIVADLREHNFSKNSKNIIDLTRIL
jgi:hypothetical protein